MTARREGGPGQRPGWCVHYGYDRAKRRPTCAVGLDPERWLPGYRDMPSPKPPYVDLCPCFLRNGQPKSRETFVCDRLRLPTPEEIALHNAWFEQQMAKQAKVGELVLAWRTKHKGTTYREVVDCPACGGEKTLSLSIAGRNHVHGRCTTKGCVSWME